MIVVDAYPGEFALGHVGRFCRPNFFDSSTQLIRTLDSRARNHVADRRPVPAHRLIAGLVDMDPEDYIRRHTLQPFLRVAAYCDDDVGTFEQPNAIRIRQRATISPIRKKPLFCGDCIAKDKRDLGFTYWRSCHQMPGVDVCPEHRTPLIMTDSVRGFDETPNEALQAGAVVESPLAEVAVQNAVVARYVDISTRFLVEGKRVSRFSASACLGARMKYLGLRVGMRGNRPVLSDFLRDHIPSRWLQEIFPNFQKKRQGVYFAAIDSACLSLLSPGHVYALALAALFEDAAEAIEEFFMSPDTRKLKGCGCLRGSATALRDQKRWELLQLYIKTRGNHSSIARSLGCNEESIRRTLRSAGLPSLHAINVVKRRNILGYLTRASPVELDRWAEQNIRAMESTTPRSRSDLVSWPESTHQ